MEEVNPQFVERQQLIYEKDPNSKVFATLAESYRRMGLLEEAFRIAALGVKKHPNYVSGQVALAKILLEKSQNEDAKNHLLKAIETSPENILAHSLLGKAYALLRKPKEALKAYKMVLFLNPIDEKAQKAVRKLESLTADEYDDEMFKMENLSASLDFVEKHTPNIDSQDLASRIRTMERLLSLADAFMVRNDYERAEETLIKAEEQCGSHPEIRNRRQMIAERNQDLPQQQMPAEEARSPKDGFNRTAFLRSLLRRINENAHS